MSLQRFPGTRVDGYMAFFANAVIGLGSLSVGVLILARTVRYSDTLWPVTGALGVLAIAAGTYSLVVGVKNLRARIVAWRSPPPFQPPHENG